MLSNLHTHTTFCDGRNTPEELVIAAISGGFCSLGFSGHGYTAYDERYCMKDTDGYRAEILRLKKTYAREIQIYLGVEEDSDHPVKREEFDYIIGSSHYYCMDGQYHPIDSSPAYFRECAERFHDDAVAMAHAYYRPFCSYIRRRKPDIVGHFDLITKFDEEGDSLFLNNSAYHAVAEQYLTSVAATGCLFEVNTGAISRGYRTSPYPHERLLQVLRRHDCGLILSSDSHHMSTLSFGFAEMRRYLKDQGFTHVYVLYDGEFMRDPL